MELQELFDMKPIMSKKNAATLASSLNMLVSGGQKNQSMILRDEVVLKKWLHNWVYSLDRKFRLDPMSVAKQQHLDFEEMFRGRKMKFKD